MKPHIEWSFRHYKPLLFDGGEIYICRIVPNYDTIHIEWLAGKNDGLYELYIGRENDKLSFAGQTKDDEFDFENLEPFTDYAFLISCDRGKSRIRLARTGSVEACEGVTVNYLHPRDEAYSFSGRYLCSPCLLRAPQGHLLASMDLYAPSRPQNLTLIYRSDDNGAMWRYACELFPCFWGRMFVHAGRLYMLGVSTEYGDLLIGESKDGGMSFEAPVVLFRGACHSGEDGIHKNPQPPVEYAGRLWFTCEWGCWAKGRHAAMVFSFDINENPLDPSAWRFTPPLEYDPAWDGAAEGKSSGCIEGTLAVLPDGQLYNIMRYDMARCVPNFGKALMFRVNANDPNAPLDYAGAMDFPGNHSKFEIRFDAVSECYYSIISRIRGQNHIHDRNLLSLMVSRDCKSWSLATDLIDATGSDPKYVGFQYVDFMFDNDDIIYLIRAAANGAHNYHDANYSVFARLKDFRRFAPK